ncbi:formate dehydrogenase subunit delta [Methylacidimicrobium cyclopophantes]|uniref:Formate dehydrogenase subunit delta n=1 Tax=Methylacidimicrobium cyclopophantes TaxID=1041766 RepID=A0A5E6MA86_9BACT|nr:formate dehydrogenase subunit delta [Methylacidimicrobium cyclopophantes]VVM06452.1 formate dehydrogenase subunit delta [Methylacidimicrobium cyclopophantes]
MIEDLVQMANQIGDFFRSYPSQAEAAAGIADHLRRFWSPSMREKLIDYAQRDGRDLSEPVRAALALLQAPAERS